MSNVKDLFQRLESERRETERNSSSVSAKFSVSLPEQDLRRLDYIAAYLDKPRSVLVRDILIQALFDAEDELGLSRIDREAEVYDLHEGTYDEDDDSRKYHTEYGLYVEDGVIPAFMKGSKKDE
ncbi:ribbon-helix-helix protein, CopG family [Paenibacillus graminis]|uniref:ribbon-helix-helix protein, CopG family n=1 Tax=Paenibacillus graminis TaxID=189425 RepID=UPI002DBE03D9|nr:ribbon-helix-helix protein, CopG family [Paenibacillus graminis]MEC0167913.1 ribbon-helix-helix protein, CopG family [Paenibacillus graminis]